MKFTKLIKIILPHEIFLLTNYNRDIIIGAERYRANILGSPIDLHRTSTLDADILKINILNKINDYVGGFVQVNDYDMQSKQIINPSVFYGQITEVQKSDNLVMVTAKSFKNKLSQYVTRSYQSHCAAQWADSRCGLNKDNFKQLIQITQKQQEKISYQIISGYNGVMYAPFVMNNLGQVLLIYNFGNLSFYTEKPDSFIVNSQYNLYAGCQRTTNNCLNYNNFDNYLGFVKE